MGRIFETRKATMFARWDKMSKAFTRAAKEIAIAAKAGGPDPEANPNLRRAIQNARTLNMPKDKIKGAIERATEKNTADYQELLYEGYGPHGVAVVVVAATDNPTRTVANVRVAFRKGGGSMGNSGSVIFNFKKVGAFRLNPEGLNLEELELELIDYGLEEMGETTGEKKEPLIVVRCEYTRFGEMQAAIEKRGITPVSSGIEYLPTAPTELPEAQAQEVLEMIDLLEQDDDVQDVFHSLA